MYSLYFILVFYSIVRYSFFNIKIITTEAFVVFLLGITVWQFFAEGSTKNIPLAVGFIMLIAIAGGFLIRSVLREVNQREQLQSLTEQLQQANEQLQVLDKARAEFISIASHQLRTPPATIKWYVAAVIAGDFGHLTEELKAALQRVEVTNNSQISLIDDLLNASRIERGKMEFFFELGDLEGMAKMTVEQLIPQAQIRKLQLRYQAPDQPMPPIMLDKEKVRQVINNFIDNAIKYTKQGSIIVSLEQTTTDVILKVTDTGRGVSLAIAPTLFQKYARGKDSASSASGLGLGLYVAKVIIEQNQGKIWVESPGEGKGSTFAFSLPIHSSLRATSVLDLAQS